MTEYDLSKPEPAKILRMRASGAVYKSCKDIVGMLSSYDNLASILKCNFLGKSQVRALL
jgi:hypothetical protein